MPWQGYFELIHQSDIFIILDDFHFSVQSYHQRNRLFVNMGQVDWYTVPVGKNSFKLPLNETRINESISWRVKAMKRLRQNYGKAPFCNEMFPLLETWLLTEQKTLADQNISLILTVCELLGINPAFRRSSEFLSASQRSEKVLELLNWCDATNYFCARGSFPYMKEDGIFPVAGIEVHFQNYIPKPYPQVGSRDDFVPYLSILDALFNIGPEKTAELVKSGTNQWDSWDSMKQLAEDVADSDGEGEGHGTVVCR